MTGHTHESRGLPPGGVTQEGAAVTQASVFLASLDTHTEADWLSSHVLDLILRAFATRDTLFPNPGCSTIANDVSGKVVDGADEFANTANALIRVGASETAQVEIVAKLGLLEITKQGAIDTANVVSCARALLWLESNSKLPILTFAAVSVGSSELTILAKSLSNLLNGSSSHVSAPALSRGEQYVAATWLMSLDAALSQQLNLESIREIVPPIPTMLNRNDCAPLPRVAGDSPPILVGTIAAAPRGPVGTALGAVTGWLLARHLCNGMFRLFLAYRTRAEVRVTHEGLEIREQKSLLGRKLRERNSLITLENVRRLSREIRYARAGTYAGLGALAIGSFLGMRLFVDGIRAPGMSLPLLWLGLAAVVGGLALDFVLANWLDASQGQCRFIVVTERGRGLCLAGVEPTEVDAVLSALAQKLVKRA